MVAGDRQHLRQFTNLRKVLREVTGDILGKKVSENMTMEKMETGERKRFEQNDCWH